MRVTTQIYFFADDSSMMKNLWCKLQLDYDSKSLVLSLHLAWIAYTNYSAVWRIWISVRKNVIPWELIWELVKCSETFPGDNTLQWNMGLYQRPKLTKGRCVSFTDKRRGVYHEYTQWYVRNIMCMYMRNEGTKAANMYYHQQRHFIGLLWDVPWLQLTRVVFVRAYMNHHFPHKIMGCDYFIPNCRHTMFV